MKLKDHIIPIQNAARYSYFAMGILMLIGSFIHLHIMLLTWKCTPSDKITCIGRSLGWNKSGKLTVDTNDHWRKAFSLKPDVLVTMWTPFVFSTVSIAQHFEGFRWGFITSSWFRTTCWLIFWSLFGIFGYASNWGVIMGFINCLWVTTLYIICVVYNDSDSKERPVLTFGSDVIRQHTAKFTFNNNADLSKTKPDDATTKSYLSQIIVHQNQNNEDFQNNEDVRDSTDAIVISQPHHIMNI